MVSVKSYRRGIRTPESYRGGSLFERQLTIAIQEFGEKRVQNALDKLRKWTEGDKTVKVTVKDLEPLIKYFPPKEIPDRLYKGLSAYYYGGEDEADKRYEGEEHLFTALKNVLAKEMVSTTKWPTTAGRFAYPVEGAGYYLAFQPPEKRVLLDIDSIPRKHRTAGITLGGNNPLYASAPVSPPGIYIPTREGEFIYQPDIRDLVGVGETIVHESVYAFTPPRIENLGVRRWTRGEIDELMKTKGKRTW